MKTFHLFSKFFGHKLTVKIVIYVIKSIDSTDIYKSFIRLYLDYEDVIYYKPSSVTFSRKIESVQYNATLGITGGIRGSSPEKLYLE